MAFPHRQTRFTMNIHGRWQTADLDESGISWVREIYQKAEVHSTGSVYVNFVPENDEERKIGPNGAKKDRLEQIKAKFDPDNLFRSNINIKPKKD
jgi:FAD/FMN-containing dehydrogenase